MLTKTAEILVHVIGTNIFLKIISKDQWSKGKIEIQVKNIASY